MIIRVVDKAIRVPEKIEKFIEAYDKKEIDEDVVGLKRFNNLTGKDVYQGCEEMYKRFEYNVFVKYGYIQDLLIFQASRKTINEIYELALLYQLAKFEILD